MPPRRMVVNIDTLVLPSRVPATRSQVRASVASSMRNANRRELERMLLGARGDHEKLTIDEAAATKGAGQLVLAVLHRVGRGETRR